MSVTIINTSAATGYFYATGITKMTSAYLLNIDLITNDTVTAPKPLAHAFNATCGPISGSVKVSFTPSTSLSQVLEILLHLALLALLF